MTTTSPLVQRAIITTSAEMDADVDLFGVPVDLPGRAVVFLTAPVRIVVKVETDPTRLKRETQALRALAGKAAVPQLWFSVECKSGEDTELDAPWVIGISYADGDRLSSLSPEEAWVDVGRELRKLHSADLTNSETHPSHPDGLNKWPTALATSARSAGLLDETIATTFLEQTIAESKTTRCPCLIHGDLTADHAFHENGRTTALIDLGDCGVGDPAYDLATLSLWHPEKIDPLLRGYNESASALTNGIEFQADIDRFHLMRLLSGALWLHGYGFTTTPYVSELYERLLDRR